MSADVSVFIATSLDGFIARKDGDLDWLDQANATVPEGEDCGYAEFMKSVDVLVMGRNTYQKVRTFGAWPYGETPVVVLSQNTIEFPEDFPNCVTHSAESPTDLHRRLSEEGAKKLYIDGGITIQRFLRAGLINEMIITAIPVLIGEGIPLFGLLEKDIWLTHQDTKIFDCGFVQSKYRVDQASN
ncbi:dihydrofolate reductase family protein [Rhodopirellula halodulae]|uniref:dihydrofolate reductase family protein n=1 Tax=Rhodopirellula halodulae TaxID=2894198 RepID=UPI001E61EADF|nr:dihydrofolate reductase family protein [Rhodopirellula sp. JC737]MCC9654515.1 dihydrofolate reductase family protein [Rhodopirellula sp. JC737]